MWQPVFMISGYILGILGLIMFVPAGLDFAETDYVRSPFIPAAVITIFLGFSLFLANITKTSLFNNNGQLVHCRGVCHSAIFVF